MNEEQRRAYDYVIAKCGAHFMPNKKVWTAHITIGYDYQKFGQSEEEAKDTLAKCIAVSPFIREQIPAA